jgi:hypothetical protein
VADNEIDFEAPSILRKWPSLNNERVPKSWGGVPYLIAEGTLYMCLLEFLLKPQSQQHLYEIHTKAQPPLVGDVLSNAELIAELARLKEFL